LALAPRAAVAQFTLNVVAPSGEQVAPAVYDFGPVYANESATVAFTLRNTSNAAATVSTLAAAGAGFALTGQTLPVGVQPGGELSFSVAFSGTSLGSYSAVLRATGVSILLTATVAPSLTYSVSNSSGVVPLTSVDFGSVVRGAVTIRGPCWPNCLPAVDFGSVVAGGNLQLQFPVRNGTPQALTVPAIAVQGMGFSLTGVALSGQVYASQQSGQFSIVFTPPGLGAYFGSLAISDRTYPLTGTATGPPLPKPASLSINLTASLQQPTLTIHFDAPSQTNGTGTATLSFQGAPDPAIVFASGTRTATFAVAPGDVQATLPFQAGTTAGVLTFSVQLGGSTMQQSATIAAVPPGIASTTGTRSTGSIQVQATGFDNTRTMGVLTFTFYDARGNILAPGPISSDATATFAAYFGSSNLGGQFQLSAVFAVTGEFTQIASCEVAMTNRAGTATGPRIVF
jgi:hypothetical protein